MKCKLQYVRDVYKYYLHINIKLEQTLQEVNEREYKLLESKCGK